MADLGHLLSAVSGILELGEVVPGNGPPGLKGVAVPGKGAKQGRIGFERGLDGGLGVDGLAKGEVGGTLWALKSESGSTPNVAKSSARAATSASGIPPMRCAWTSSGSGSGVLST